MLTSQHWGHVFQPDIDKHVLSYDILKSDQYKLVELVSNQDEVLK